MTAPGKQVVSLIKLKWLHPMPFENTAVSSVGWDFPIIAKPLLPVYFLKKEPIFYL
jgi:hypothetical protein